MTHKIKIGNREIKLSEPQKKMLDSISQKGLIIKYGVIKFAFGDGTSFIYNYRQVNTIEALIKKGCLIKEKISETESRIIKSY